MAVECEFQALTLVEAREEIQAYKARSHKPIWGRGWPKTMKLPSSGFMKTPMGLDYSPGGFLQGRRKNRLSDSHGDHGDPAPRQMALDRNNSASGQQLP